MTTEILCNCKTGEITTAITSKEVASEHTLIEGVDFAKIREQYPGAAVTK